MPEPLEPHDLRPSFEPARVPWETTDDADVVPGSEIPHQPRAIAAMELGTTISREGFNVFAMGVEGTGRHHLVLRHLEERATQLPVPSDLCYVHNFDEPRRPTLLSLPPGRGPDLRDDMERFVEDLPTVLESAFESEEYHARREAIESEFADRGERSLEDIRKRAEKEGLALLRTPGGVAFAPARDGEVLSEEEYKELPEDVREQLEERLEEYQDEIQKTLRQFPRWDRERRGMVRELNREITDLAVGQLLEEVRQKHQDLPQVLAFLDAVQQDVSRNPRKVIRTEGPQLPGMPQAPKEGEGDRRAALRQYRVNVLVRHEDGDGAPVIHEDNPTFENLVGRMEHVSRYMSLVTDFTLIRAGALHRANNGFLVLEARKVLQAPFAWEALKRALRSRKVKIESPGQSLGLAGLVTLEPEPAPLDVRVVLIGEPFLFHLLMALDPEFQELFKVPADFDDLLPGDEEGLRGYCRLVASIVRREELLPFDRHGVARALEEGLRWAGHQERLSARVSRLADLLREASHRSREKGLERVGREQVAEAVAQAEFRSDRLRTRILDEIRRGTILLDVTGVRAGQVNGLSVLSLGTFSFGRPSRITARVRLGNGKVVDIEREVEMGGPIHSKGVLILTGYLGSRYALDRPFSLLASLVFEQSYSGVEGDSASAAELLALVSAIARVPLDQGLAVTGSVNQHGQIQPVGGVNEKIEGFFDACQVLGLTGDQGVLIPRGNVQHLVLREDVVEAVREGRFRVIAVETVDEAVQLLSGLPAGERGEDGVFPEDSFNRRVEDRLVELAEQGRRFSRARDGSEGAAS